MVFSALVLLSQLATGQLFVGFSFSQEYMTNAANETGATVDGNQTNQTGGDLLNRQETWVVSSAPEKIDHNI